ncbi:methyltransferase domain-containing protein [Maridesulfovibrio ferrireducens]|uniref:methyltransferase domain-containing protein n=1 Tax=Maridesulfovibrio ferrireducens TaxID=246191 RepID=UPI001A31EA00|nr:methyltransferase domain-containing protein [Maridesulfovibrio ferrireducens]MBI9110640.1 methyltransferase domain-containing protein [Maridesulfovibrio ferrireducens]
MKKRIRQCFGKAATCYSDAASVQKKVAFQCAQYCPKGHYKKVLDVGSGVGFLFNELEKRITYDNYVSLDLVHPMLMEQKELSVPLLVAADGENIPFKEGQFDLLVSSSAMQWYANPEESIPESFKMLKRGGKFTIAIFVKGTLCELADVSSRTGFGSVKDLKDSKFYIDVLSGISNVRVNFNNQRHEVYFPSVAGFLKNHKMTGAVASSGNISWGKEKYLRFVKEYENLYGGDQGIRVSYEVLFASGEVL